MDGSIAALVVAAQSLLIGGVLSAVAAMREGAPSQGLRMRGVAMLYQGVGYLMIARREVLPALVGATLSGALVMGGHVLTFIGLRRLLGLREYRRAATFLIGAAWLAMIVAQTRVDGGPLSPVLGQTYSVLYAAAVIWPVAIRLRSAPSLGAILWVATGVFMGVSQLGWLVSGAFPISPTLARAIALWLVVLMPTLTGIAFLLMYFDVAQSELRRIAETDPLTDVRNRRGLVRALRQRLATSSPGAIAVLVLDVDRFKQVNDRFGHATGDLTLSTIAGRLRRELDPADALGRIGGEEFVVVATRREATQSFDLAERLRASVREVAIDVGDEIVKPTISIGVAFADEPGLTAEVLLERADKALYQAKRNGRDCVSVWRRTAV